MTIVFSRRGLKLSKKVFVPIFSRFEKRISIYGSMALFINCEPFIPISLRLRSIEKTVSAGFVYCFFLFEF